MKKIVSHLMGFVQSIIKLKNYIRNLLYSTDPKYELQRVEIYLILTIILLILVVFLGIQRRSCSSNLVRYLLFGAYVGFSSIISYTMGVIYNIQFRHVLLVLWAGLVVNVYVSVDTIVANSLMDLEQRYRYWLELFLLAFWFSCLVDLYNIDLVIFLLTQALCWLLIYKSGERLQAFELACQSGLAKFAKPTADYMRFEHEETSDPDEIDPSRMQGYKYLLEDPAGEKDYVTLEKLWEFQGKTLSTQGGHSLRLKDICLSFALFKLVLRRFAGYTLYEASLDKTWEFVRDGLLGNQGEYTRPFKVIEGELHFLYDFFYTKYCVLAEHRSFTKKTISILVYAVCSLYIFFLLSPQLLKAGKCPTVEFHGSVIDVGVTRVAFVVMTLVEILQLFMLVLSDWTIVRWLVLDVKTQSLNRFQVIVLTKLVPLAHKYPITLKPWQRKLGQYSFLDDYAGVPFRTHVARFFPFLHCMSVRGIGQINHSDINLSVEVKKAVIEALIGYNSGDGAPKLTNGITSLTRNGVANKLSWACHLETQAQVVMVWHIATTIISQTTSTPASGINETDYYFHVATSLSKYCAYLVAFAPDLLSEHSYITQCFYVGLVNEGLRFLGGKGVAMEIKIQKLMVVKEEDPFGCTALKQSGLLAQCLLNNVDDQTRMWKVLADFWVELMLFLAPADNAMTHAKYLARGGEFITHLWALLTHAGILKVGTD